MLRSKTKEMRNATAKRIQTWFRRHIRLHRTRSRGPAYYVRALCVNDTDFFSTDPVADISGCMFVSYKDPKNHIYGFDIRSIATLINRAEELSAVSNPFNRDPIPLFEVQKVLKLVRQLKRYGLPTEWDKLAPTTPLQQYRMKVVDVFAQIDELNYYSSPDWFLSLTLPAHRTFYKELHSIWTHRANLIPSEKQRIVPGYNQTLFRHPPWAVNNFTMERLQTMNLNTILMLITSATDRNDRILGAMYTMSALTLVHPDARTAYPWLYESVVADPYVDELGPMYMVGTGTQSLFGMPGWLADLIQLSSHTQTPLLMNGPATTDIAPMEMDSNDGIDP